MTSIFVNPVLDDDQIAFFDREGYLVVDNLFRNSDLEAVIREITAEVTMRAQRLVDAGKLSDTFVNAGFERQLARITSETDEVARAIWNGVLSGPAIFDLIRHPRLLDLAEQFCGLEIIASSVYRLRPKVPHHRQGPVPWHQDSGYFEPYCDKALVLTVWLPLVDADESNGCLYVVPRCHKGEIFRHGSRPDGKPYLEIKEAFGEEHAVPVPVRKGGVLLLTNRTPHASFENETDRVRWSMDLRYQSAHLPTNAPITRLPHEISADSDSSAPIACYPPEADFLVRSRLRPSEVVTDPAVFNRIRTNHQAQPVTDRWAAVSK